MNATTNSDGNKKNVPARNGRERSSEKRNRMRLSAAEVGLVFRADADDFAFRDEERNHDREAGFDRNGLLRVAGGVTLDGRRRFRDLHFDGSRKVDRDRLFFNEENVVGLAFDEEAFGVLQRSCGNRVFFKRFRVGENVVSVRLVKEFELLNRVFENVKRSTDVRTHRNDATRSEGTQFHLAVGSVVRRRAHLAFENEAEIVVVADDVLALNVIDGCICHKF